MDTPPDPMGRTALHYAALDNAADAARTLVDQGAELNARDRSGMTPLHFAAQQGSSAVARILIDAGAAIDSEDDEGNTPLWAATSHGRGEGDLITLLRKHGADPRKPNRYGVTPASLADSIANYPVRRWFADVLDRPRP